jgi:hypothetical protein
VVSRIEGASAQIVAYDIRTRIAQAALAAGEAARSAGQQVDPIELPRAAADLRG